MRITWWETDVAGLFLQTSAPERVGTIILHRDPGTPLSLAFPVQLGNLADVRRLSRGMFPRPLAKSISRGIACGLSHMHDHHILHRDLKPQNVLMGTDDVGVLIPRIADFGWARSIREAAGGASQPPSGHRGLTPGAVTPYWRPLEIELELQYSFPADLWSLGLRLDSHGTPDW